MSLRSSSAEPPHHPSAFGWWHLSIQRHLGHKAGSGRHHSRCHTCPATDRREQTLTHRLRPALHSRKSSESRAQDHCFATCRKFSVTTYLSKTAELVLDQVIGNAEIADFRNPTSKILAFIYIQEVADKIWRQRIRAGLFSYNRGSSKFSLLRVLAVPEVIQLVQTRCSHSPQL